MRRIGLLRHLTWTDDKSSLLFPSRCTSPYGFAVQGDSNRSGGSGTTSFRSGDTGANTLGYVT